MSDLAAINSELRNLRCFLLILCAICALHSSLIKQNSPNSLAVYMSV